MLVNTQGYVFECREDIHGSIGVMESYVLRYKDDTLRISLVLGVDSAGKIVIPAYMNKSLGFRPLRESCETKEQVFKFAKSNKPYFSVLGEFSLLASGILIFDKDTKEVRSTDELFFYLPKTVSKTVDGIVDNKGNQQPALICERVNVNNGLNTFCVSPEIYNSYLQNLLNGLDKDALEDRGLFLNSIVF